MHNNIIMLRQPLWIFSSPLSSPSSSRLVMKGTQWPSPLISAAQWQRCTIRAYGTIWNASNVRSTHMVSPSSIARLANPSLRHVSQRHYHQRLGTTTSLFQSQVLVVSSKWHRLIYVVRTSSTSANTTTTAAATAAANATPVAKAAASNKWWRRVAWFVKYTRIPILILGIYGLGYQQGIIDYAREPHLLQQGLLLHALSGLGVTSMDQVDVLRVTHSSSRRTSLDVVNDNNESDVQEEHPTRRPWLLRRRKTAMVVLNRTNTINSLTNQQVAMVGHHMVHTAQAFVRAELAKAQQEARGENEPESTTTNTNKTPPTSLSFPIKPKQQQQQQQKSKQMEDSNPHEDENVEFWLQAQRRLEGGDWQYVLVDTPIPNAFVAEILPRRIFVTTGLLESLATRNKENVGKKRIANGFVSNSDELALVLGHEVSHLILGHVSKRNQVEALLRTLEVLLLSLDPTEGLLSLYIVTMLAGVRAAISACYSRDDERQADELGMILCAMAGCDLTKACHVFYKMAQAEGGVESASVMSSHPPTMERYEFLTEKAKELTEIQQQELQQGKFKALLSFR